jgi:hypothetical protein
MKKDGETRSGRSCLKHLAPQIGGIFKSFVQKFYIKKRCEEKRQRKRDLAELEHDKEEFKLKREEVTKMAQTFHFERLG